MLVTAPAVLHQAVDSLAPALFRPVDDSAAGRFQLEADASHPTSLRLIEAGMVTMLPMDTTGPGIAGTTVDSNADVSGNVAIQTLGPGHNDHTFDIGIYPSPAFPMLGDSPLATFTGSLAIVGLGTAFALRRRAGRPVTWQLAKGVQ
ncbi:hypothetical protein [Kitasatospora sp. MMS16-BH015]|uniref:hypothetical protein n=1 Tax=Kitasatospora sp. MMS16-BH015 TaxID=2018025 RepID=UPI001C2BEE8E|nr:hypothetical protein [Kitasatospora sp. MMS16-BH015]